MFRKTTLILICLSCIIWIETCFAQDDDILTKPIDYFGDKEKEVKEKGEQEKLKKLQAKKEGKKIVEDPWVVPITQPDGTIRYHRPPQVVIDFLDNPNEKTVGKYLEWNRKRIEKYLKASEVLQKHSAKKGIVKPYYSTSGQVYDLKEIKKYGSVEKYISETGGLKIVYFTRPDCPHCKVQSSELVKFLKNHKNVSIQGISLGKAEGSYSFPMSQDKGEGSAYNVDYWPTLLFVFPDGKTYRLEGAVTAVKLEKLLDEVRKARAVQKK